MPLSRKNRTVQDQDAGIPIQLNHRPGTRSLRGQLIVPVPLRRRAASAIEPVIEGYTVNDSDT
jgi:hypothetical protein